MKLMSVVQTCESPWVYLQGASRHIRYTDRIRRLLFELKYWSEVCDWTCSISTLECIGWVPHVWHNISCPTWYRNPFSWMEMHFHSMADASSSSSSTLYHIYATSVFSLPYLTVRFCSYDILWTLSEFTSKIEDSYKPGPCVADSKPCSILHQALYVMKSAAKGMYIEICRVWLDFYFFSCHTLRSWFGISISPLRRN
jgi:hypothetical protein